MHEMGIVFELMDTLKGIMKEENIHLLKEVKLEVGEASMVVPKYLKDCWKMARVDTEFASTKLVIHVLPAWGLCLSCGHRFSVKRNNRRCPYCDSVDHFKTVSGMDMEITSLTAVS